MKKNYLQLSEKRSNFYSIALKFKNLSAKIDQLIHSGKFQEFSNKDQGRLVSKLRRLFEKLSSINPRYALKIAGAAMCFALISSTANAQTYSEWPDNPFSAIADFQVLDGVFADIDGDGDLDAILLNNARQPVYFKNVGGVYTANSVDNPFFLNGCSYSAYNGTGIDIADFDGDGVLDAILIDGANSGHVQHLRLSSEGRFEYNSSDFINDNSGSGFYIQGGYKAKFADVDGDGDLDILTVECGQGLTTLYQSSNHEFEKRQGDPLDSDAFPFLSNDVFLNMADMDGDGDVDLFAFTLSGGYSPGALNDATGFVHYFENNGSGGFTENSNIPLPVGQMSPMHFPLLVDLDGDGDIDIFTPTAMAGTSNLQNLGGGPSVPFTPLAALALFAAGGFGIFRRNRKRNKA